MESRKDKDNKRRLESLQQRSETVRSQQNLIKQALSSIDQTNLKSKKIFFDDDGKEADVEGPAVQAELGPRKKKKKKNTESEQKTFKLFEDEDEDAADFADDKQFRVRPQFEGEKGQKLLQLQSRFGNDERFQLDERFAADFAEKKPEQLEEAEDDISNEKEKQLAILQSICPTAPTLAGKDQKKLKPHSFVRFDPSAKGHTKFERKENDEADERQQKGKDKKKKKSLKEADVPVEEEPLPEVSADRYFTTAENLTSMFQKKTEENQGFSLRKMFQGNAGDDQEDMETEEESAKTVPEKPSQTSAAETDAAKEVDAKTQQSQSFNYWKNSGMWKEPFFFAENDSRLYDGMDFLRNGTNDSVYNDRNKWSEFREKLVRFYKNKMRRAASLNTGPKPIHTAELPEFQSNNYTSEDATEKGRKKQTARKFHVRTRKVPLPTS